MTMTRICKVIVTIVTGTVLTIALNSAITLSQAGVETLHMVNRFDIGPKYDLGVPGIQR
jgi:hypothetical protein